MTPIQSTVELLENVGELLMISKTSPDMGSSESL
jgi:hypothetical protein